MTAGDRERWNEKHRRVLGEELAASDPFVLRALERIPFAPGRTAIDLACGRGRHALELARRGWRVSAWDVSPIALESVRARAATEGLEVATREIDLSAHTPIDLGELGERVDLLVCVNFLERELFARFAELLRSQGHLVFVTFTVDAAGEHPARAHRLARGELARGLPELATVWHEELDGRAGLLARRSSEPRASAP